MRRAILFGAAIGLGLGIQAPSRAEAQTASRADSRSSGEHLSPPPLALAVRRTAPITLDGKLDEPEWQAATPAADFRQAQPNEGQPASQRTEVRFLLDDNALYIGARMYDTEGPTGIRTRLVRRDDFFNSDYVEIIFDTYHDHQGRMEFMTNPSGSKEDSYGPNGANLDPSWDAVWDVKTRVDSLGWVAEFRIPLSQLRFSAARLRADLGAPSLAAGGPPQRAVAVVVLAPQRGRRAAALRASRGSQPHPGAWQGRNPPVHRGPLDEPGFRESGGSLHRLHQADARIGADFKYHVTSNLSLSGTVNPDFGQVEVDPAVVNLSAFETFYSEKRPFFVEGAGMFGFGSFNCYFCSNVSSPSLFYSRRIGRAPQGAGNAYARGSFADVPDNTQILGAAKLTGNVAPGWTLATLDAATARELAPVDSAGQRLNVQVEPFTNYFVGHLSRDLGGGSYIRGMVTSVVRDLGDSTLRTQLNSHSEAAGLETNLWWGKRTWRLMSNVAFTQVAGDPQDILGKQRSSARYFQRPDRDIRSDGLFSSRYDSSATALRGYEFYGRLAKDAGDWMWELSTHATSPGFEANDVAFNSQADRIWMSTNLARQFTRPTSLFRNSWFSFGGQQAYNYTHDLVDRQIQAYGQVQLLNYWNLQGFVIYRFPRLDDQLARGGPVLERAPMFYRSASIQTDSRKWLVLMAQPDYFCADTRCSWDMMLDVTIKPASNISIELMPSYSYLNTGIQYVTSVADPTATTMYGRRYVFADLHERSLAMDTRLNVTFTPELTLQLYAQPLIASGFYANFKEYNRPRAMERSVYGADRGTISYAGGTYTVDPDGSGPAQPFSFGDPNFNFRSLRGSAVLRWEYHPGATLYVVWTQSRSTSASDGDIELGRDLRGLLGTRSENIFLIKATYWLGL